MSLCRAIQVAIFFKFQHKKRWFPSAIGLQWNIKKSKEQRSKKIAELGVRCRHWFSSSCSFKKIYKNGNIYNSWISNTSLSDSFFLVSTCRSSFVWHDVIKQTPYYTLFLSKTIWQYTRKCFLTLLYRTWFLVILVTKLGISPTFISWETENF